MFATPPIKIFYDILDRRKIWSNFEKKKIGENRNDFEMIGSEFL